MKIKKKKFNWKKNLVIDKLNDKGNEKDIMIDSLKNSIND